MENNKEYKIYTLADPRTPDNIRYVGVTVSRLEKRLTQHIHDAKYRHAEHRHLFNFLRTIIKDNLRPEIKLLDVCNEDTWENAEIYWINQFRNWGFDLTNTAPGGRRGGVGKHSEFTKNKIKQILKNKSTEWHKKRLESIKQSRIGFKHSEETLELMRINNKKTMLGKTHSPEAREKLRKANLGKKLSEEHKNKLKLILKIKREAKLLTQPIKIKNPITPKKSVLQFDLLTGKIINEFNSIKEASRETGIGVSGITACCHKRRNKAGNYAWTFKNDNPELKIFKSKTILQYDLNGNFIKQFIDMKELSSEIKVNTGLVSAVCLGTRNKTSNFIFKYHYNEKEIPLKIEVK